MKCNPVIAFDSCIKKDRRLESADSLIKEIVGVLGIADETEKAIAFAVFCSGVREHRRRYGLPAE